MARQLDLVDSATRMMALKGNHRLADRWAEFERRGVRSVIANTVIAREFAGWCWAVASEVQEAGQRKPAYAGESVVAA